MKRIWNYLFKKEPEEPKEPNYCIECKYFLPADQHIKEINRCRFANCTYNLPDKVIAVNLVCPELSKAALKELRDELDYCTLIRKRFGNYCPYFEQQED
jgi:hypothetical protein